MVFIKLLSLLCSFAIGSAEAIDFTNFNNSDYNAQLLGPILITAPHTTRFYVGNGSDLLLNDSYLLSQRDHLREIHLAELVPKLSAKIDEIMGENSSSFMTWADPRENTKYDLDPNYLYDSI